MLEERCTVCGRRLDEGTGPTDNDTYAITFKSGVCRLCGVTLLRAFDGIVDMLRNSHGEKRERVVDRLMHRLQGAGFDVGDSFVQRRRAG